MGGFITLNASATNQRKKTKRVMENLAENEQREIIDLVLRLRALGERLDAVSKEKGKTEEETRTELRRIAHSLVNVQREVENIGFNKI